MVADYLREMRPPPVTGFEHRFETPPGAQTQVDFAHFKFVFVRRRTDLSVSCGCLRMLHAKDGDQIGLPVVSRPATNLTWSASPSAAPAAAPPHPR